MKNLILAFFLIMTPLSVRADDVVKTFPAGGAADVLEHKTHAEDDAGAIRIENTCKTNSGKTVKKGDAKYEACLKEKLEKPKK